MAQMKIVYKLINNSTKGTNACSNGKFTCSNRFYEPKVISTSKLNDGICDCCDGSDEFNLSCQKTCIDLSTKEYDKLMDHFLTLKMVVMNFQEENYKSFFEYHKELLEKIISTYNDLKDLIEKRYLLKSYLNKMENTLNEEKEDFIDENKISFKDLNKLVNNLDDRIQLNYDALNENESMLKLYKRFSFLIDLYEDCHRLEYKYMDCEICNGEFNCSGNKGSKHRTKFFGYD